MKTSLILLALATMIAPRNSAAQDVASQVSAIERGTVRVRYTTRAGVCGNEDNIQLDNRRRSYRGRADEPCFEGPAFVQLEVRNGRVHDATVRVGQSSWPSAGSTITDLGRQPPTSTSLALLDMAKQASEDAGDDLVFAAVLADSTELVQPLLRLARSAEAEMDTREAAVFWLGQAVDEDVVAELEDLAQDGGLPMDVRESAVFALSQAEFGDGRAALMNIARSDGPVELRENAVFWLGQTGGPEVVAFLAELARSSSALGEKAVFALSQLNEPDAQQALRDMVTDERVDRAVRENAIFWLGQADDDEGFAFLRTAYRQLDDRELKEKVIFSISQIDDDQSTAWLIAVAKDPAEAADTRKSALFWAGQTEEAGAELIAMYDEVGETDIKEQLIFVYSQQESAAMLQKLMEIARTDPDHDLRENAVFWLGQSDAPEAMAFLEELINN